MEYDLETLELNHLWFSFWRKHSTGVSAITEAWDGTTWTEVADLATARGMYIR